MKKTVTTILLSLLVTGTLFAQRGTYSVSVKSITCLGETADDILDMDGKKDEVFVILYYSITKPGTQPVRGHTGTKIYGDMNGFTDYTYHRLRGGTASGSGGIRSGDVIDINQDLIGGRLEDNSLITLIPVVWEQDVKTTNASDIQFTSFLTTMKNAMNTIEPLAPAMLQNIERTRPQSVIRAYVLPWNAFSTQPSFSSVLNKVNGVPGNRPVGMNSYGEFHPKVLFLNNFLLGKTNRSENFSEAHMESIRTVDFDYDEVLLGNTRDHGKYRITLRVTWNPDPVAPAPPPAVQTPGTIIKSNPVSPVKANATIKNTGQILTTPLTNDIVTGVWKGTQGSMNANADEPLNIKLGNYVFWLLRNDGSGISQYAGGYRIENGILKGSYTDNNNRVCEYTSTGYSANTGELSGNWTCTGAGYYKTGKWIMKKISN